MTTPERDDSLPVEAEVEETKPARSAEEKLRLLEEEGDIAADYLEELLDIADLDGDIDIDVDGDRASLEIRSADQLSDMNGSRGELLEALQELTRLAVQTKTGNRSRLMLDIGGFRAQRKASLEERAEDAIEQVAETGQPVHLQPMNAFERKVIHDVVREAGLASASDGEGKQRHVIVYPAK
ncbi:single-stranded DNA-binding protein [Dermabacteraceae bacterium TAE3-ERU27]|nr:single-stranded DNA-binding protein [Dermabacteraceae bacterium TAE3-ERU27]